MSSAPILGVQDDSVIITGHSVVMDFAGKNTNFKELPDGPRRRWELQSMRHISAITIEDTKANTTTTLAVSPGLTFVFGYRLKGKLNWITIDDKEKGPITVDCDRADFNQPGRHFEHATAKLQSFVEIFKGKRVYRVLQIDPSDCVIYLRFSK